jgi:hypothetical protein
MNIGQVMKALFKQSRDFTVMITTGEERHAMSVNLCRDGYECIEEFCGNFRDQSKVMKTELDPHLAKLISLN